MQVVRCVVQYASFLAIALRALYEEQISAILLTKSFTFDRSYQSYWLISCSNKDWMSVLLVFEYTTWPILETLE